MCRCANEECRGSASEEYRDCGPFLHLLAKAWLPAKRVRGNLRGGLEEEAALRAGAAYVPMR